MNKVFSHPKMYPISLGFNCHVKFVIIVLGEMDKTVYMRLPFDWVGTPMWAICDLFENNFEDFTNNLYYEIKPRYENKNDKHLINTKYDIVFAHDYGNIIDIISKEKYEKVETDYKRRVLRLQTILQSSVKLFFIRFEQDITNRIDLPEQQQQHDEYYYVEKFAGILQLKGYAFTILYITPSHETGFDKEKNICRIQYKNPSNKLMDGNEIKQIIFHNQKFIKMCLE